MGQVSVKYRSSIGPSIRPFFPTGPPGGGWTAFLALHQHARTYSFIEAGGRRSAPCSRRTPHVRRAPGLFNSMPPTSGHFAEAEHDRSTIQTLKACKQGQSRRGSFVTPVLWLQHGYAETERPVLPGVFVALTFQSASGGGGEGWPVWRPALHQDSPVENQRYGGGCRWKTSGTSRGVGWPTWIRT